MPQVINHSIELLSNGGLGMAMFSLGMFIYKLSLVSFLVINYENKDLKYIHCRCKISFILTFNNNIFSLN